jgi:hypothetical protein
MADEAQAAQADEKSSKKKKINRISTDELNKKIDDFTASNQTKSVYYRHLMARKSEITPK